MTTCLLERIASTQTGHTTNTTGHTIRETSTCLTCLTWTTITRAVPGNMATTPRMTDITPTDLLLTPGMAGRIGVIAMTVEERGVRTEGGEEAITKAIDITNGNIISVPTMREEGETMMNMLSS